MQMKPLGPCALGYGYPERSITATFRHATLLQSVHRGRGALVECSTTYCIPGASRTIIILQGHCAVLCGEPCFTLTHSEMLLQTELKCTLSKAKKVCDIDSVPRL